MFLEMVIVPECFPEILAQDVSSRLLSCFIMFLEALNSRVFLEILSQDVSSKLFSCFIMFFEQVIFPEFFTKFCQVIFFKVFFLFHHVLGNNDFSWVFFLKILTKMFLKAPLLFHHDSKPQEMRGSPGLVMFLYANL